MAATKPLRLAIVTGEESGDLLGADLVQALRRQYPGEVTLTGVGGDHLSALGLNSLFDQHEIALVGLSAIVTKLPQLIRRISQLAKAIIAAKPDCLVIIDSPDFTHRVARKVRAADPSIPIINYISPSVWAWRPERAKAMRSYIDHVLAILPFEVQALKDLDGPPATYVGHRLVSYAPLLAAAEQNRARENSLGDRTEHNIVVLPGSRRAEITSLSKPFGEAIELLSSRGNRFRLTLPTLPKVESLVRQLTADWKVQPNIVVGESERLKAFAEADAALAASGTVSLELALARIPTVLSYRPDWLARIFIAPRIKVWSAALPNIIADKRVVQEYFNQFVRPGPLAREIEQLLKPGYTRSLQLEGFDEIAALMQTERPSGEIAAEKVLEYVRDKA
ncbi:lipid-A-disaccharide synthase [Phyllobacterium myrsinacearum]|uniref:Lipid-A-disaccharide synthase n=2 Tax=Phyllobacterium myrsinacearum TaxID=28101 RepID=A0A839EVC1_9HYPH|nr:lipid-A-disaccharide synthase [Phyllobacterium myrsinacearum]MBA8880377.1 lipid-A-disaccharide synthase [Phyllobacterium myrsinacearum]